MRSLEYPVVKAGVCLGHIRGHMVLLRYINDLLDNDMFLHRDVQPTRHYELRFEAAC